MVQKEMVTLVQVQKYHMSERWLMSHCAFGGILLKETLWPN